MQTKQTPSPTVGFFFFQAEDGIRDLVRSRGLGDVYKRQDLCLTTEAPQPPPESPAQPTDPPPASEYDANNITCLLYTSDAADERSSVDLGGRRIIKKKTCIDIYITDHMYNQ